MLRFRLGVNVSFSIKTRESLDIGLGHQASTAYAAVVRFGYYFDTNNDHPVGSGAG